MRGFKAMRARHAHLALAAVVAALRVGVAAHAGEPDLCRLPEVLELVRVHYLRQTAHLRLIPGTAAEIATRSGRSICAVEVEVVVNSEIAALPGAVALRESRDYRVRRANTGVEIDFGGR